MPTTYSRDQLLLLRASATLLNHDQCLKITQLGLRRRGCRAGNHTRRSRQAAHSVTSSTRCTSTCGEIPVINGHRLLFTNNDQLFSCRRGEWCRAEPTVCQSCSKTTSRRRRRQLSSRCSALRAVPLCRRVVLKDALSASCSSARLSRGVDEPAPSGYRLATVHHGRRKERKRVLRTVTTASHQPASSSSGTKSPSLYVLNAASLTKPYAVEQLAADLRNYNMDVAAISKTHLKTKHTDSVVTIEGYTLLRRDRKMRKGGGVAMYVRKSCSCSPTEWTFSADDRTYELLWVQVGAAFIGVIYHPPRPTYTAESMLSYIESCIDEILRVPSLS